MYNGDEIISVSHNEAIRRRPGMYLGGTDVRALHHMIDKVLDNAVDYALAGKCDRIEITLRRDNEVCIRDYSPGISVEPIFEGEISLLEAVFLEVNGFGERRGLGPYGVSGGLHGIGLSAINPLTEWMRVESRYDGFLWQLEFKTGIQEHPLQRSRALEQDEPSGTSITFKPDFTLLDTNDFDFDKVAGRSREISYLIPGLTLLVRDERVDPAREETFHAPDGIAALARELARPSKPLHPLISADINLNITWTEYQFTNNYSAILRFACVFTEEKSQVLRGFVNTIPTLRVGTYLDGFRDGVERFLNHISKGNSTKPIRWEDVEANLVVAISLLHPSPLFLSVSSLDLQNPDVVEPISNAAFNTFAEFAAAHPDQVQKILRVCHGAVGEE